MFFHIRRSGERRSHALHMRECRCCLRNSYQLFGVPANSAIHASTSHPASAACSAALRIFIGFFAFRRATQDIPEMPEHRTETTYRRPASGVFPPAVALTQRLDIFSTAPSALPGHVSCPSRLLKMSKIRRYAVWCSASSYCRILYPPT
ncbi:hypothetical protein C8R43DRAFT_1135668 [Mycena crocata]|nr:hypothetical protein C8R43DRAFT_1135668 [Mycena crocata]